MRLSRVGGMVTFFAGVAGAGTAVSDPFYFASIDYYASANAAVVSANNSYPDGKSASGFPAIDQPGPLSAAASPLAYVSPDGVSYGTGFVDASGHIDPAVLGVDIHGTVSAQSGSGDFFNDVYYASAGSGATVDDRWMDQVTLNVPGHDPGELFTVHANLQLDGAMSWNFNANLHDGRCGGVVVPADSENYYATLNVLGTGVPVPPSSQQGHWGFWRGQRSFTQGEVINTNIDPPQTIGWEQPVYEGQVTNLFMELAGSVSGGATAAGCDSNLESAGLAYALTFSHTLLWGGIASITDSLGNPVTDYTLTSLSGFDYRYPATEVSNPPPGAVPEPGTAALLLLAAAIATRMDRRRRRSATSIFPPAAPRLLRCTPAARRS